MLLPITQLVNPQDEVTCELRRPAVTHEVNLSDECVASTFLAKKISYESPTVSLDELQVAKLEKVEDGSYLGEGGAAYAPTTDIFLIEPVRPEVPLRERENERIIYINGITTSASRSVYEMEAVAKASGIPVVGIYNETSGNIPDVFQAICDKANVLENPACSTLYNVILANLHKGEPVFIVGQSHGALIVSRALERVQDTLNDLGLTKGQIDRELKNISVVTFGTAAWSYPDGPRYVHYINDRDPISFHFGLAPYGLCSSEISQKSQSLVEPVWLTAITGVLDFFEVDLVTPLSPGKDARIIRVQGEHAESDWWDTHYATKYAEHWKPFEEAYQSALVAKVEEPLAASIFRGIKGILSIAGVVYLAQRLIERLKRRWSSLQQETPETGAVPVSEGTGETEVREAA